MATNPYADEVRELKKFFDKSTSAFEEKDSKFAPKKGMFTVAQHVAHVAQTVDWFIEGAFRKEGFSMDFEPMTRDVLAVSSLKAARTWLNRACKRAIQVLEAKTAADMKKKITGALMAGEPRSHMLAAMTDHSAHHRGALTVYARLLGRVPPMPYL